MIRRHVLMFSMLVLAAGCGGDDDDDSGDTCDPEAAPGAVVLTSDFATSSYGWAPSGGHGCFAAAGTAEGDTVASVSNGTIVVVERTLGSITVLGPDLAVLHNCSVADDEGGAPNPHDVAVVSDTELYVARYGQSTVAIVDPTSCTITTTVDLAAEADEDGLPEMDAITAAGSDVFVSLELLDPNYAPTGNGKVVAIDTESRETRTIDLPRSYPFGRFRTHGGTGELLLALVGTFGAADGALVAIDPDTDEVREVVTEEQLGGGDLNAFAIADDHHGWAILSTDITTLVPFDPSTGEAGEPLITSTGFDLRDIELVGDELWVADGSATSPGLRAFDLEGNELTPPGATDLPPSLILAL